MAAPMIPCTEHGPSAWCYIQDDSSHLDSEECACFSSYVPWCRVDSHCHEAESQINEAEMWGPSGRPTRVF